MEGKVKNKRNEGDVHLLDASNHEEKKLEINESGNTVQQELEAGKTESSEKQGSEVKETEDDEETYQKRRELRKMRMRKRRRRQRRMKILTVSALALIIAVTVIGVSGRLNGIITEIKEAGSRGKAENTEEIEAVQQSATTGAAAEAGAEVKRETEPETEPEPEVKKENEKQPTVLEEANLLAAQYDYDRAIELLKSDRSYDRNQEMQDAVKKFEEIKATCVSWPLEEVTHIFYHTLIKDPGKSFDGDYKAADYNQVMTTIDEFNKITQEMYNRGYVMVSLYDMATVNEDGTMTRGEILLPPGKIPFVLSQDDVSYYHYMDGDGYATKLIVDEEGKVRNEYVEDDGTVSVGDYDMVPLIDRFVEAHPDFSYRGAKGIVALTGYNGVLGYRTDISYQTRPADLDANKVQWLDNNPDFDLEKERAEAKKVADAMRANGWLFASHTWGHKNVAERSLEALQTDTQLFKENVDPIIGGTDIIIFAFGVDLTDYADYSGEKFDYFKSQGYHYYCNVDSSQYFVQIRDNYLRQGRRNVDGYRMYYNPDMLDDLFDVDSVFDSSRPVPVAQM